MDLHRYNTLILSDLHLGSETSHAREATRALKRNRFRRLILLGDIFADLNFARLTKDHWKFLGYIRKLSNPKRNIEVIFIRKQIVRRGSQLKIKDSEVKINNQQSKI
jgi:metallophosphoesterase superfamily enzyme